MSRRGDRGPPNTEGMVSLKVDNLTYRTTPDMLKRVFEKYGDVGDVYIPRDPYTQESRGFAFVRYFDERDADDAIDRLNGTLLDGRELRVQLAKHARPPMSRRAGYSSSSSSSHRKNGRRSHSRSRSRSRERRRRSRSRSDSRSHRRNDRFNRSSGGRHSGGRAASRSGGRRSPSENGRQERERSRSNSPDRKANNRSLSRSGSHDKDG